jgi:hypothetical protein
MREVATSSEAEMVAALLRGELASSRFGSLIHDLLRRDGRSLSVIQHANLHDPEDNRFRLHLLDAYRGFGARTGLFDGFPRDVRWARAFLSPEELAQVRHINDQYWVELSGGHPATGSRRNEDCRRPRGLWGEQRASLGDRCSLGPGRTDSAADPRWQWSGGRPDRSRGKPTAHRLLLATGSHPIRTRGHRRNLSSDVAVDGVLGSAF